MNPSATGYGCRVTQLFRFNRLGGSDVPISICTFNARDLYNDVQSCASLEQRARLSAGGVAAGILNPFLPERIEYRTRGAGRRISWRASRSGACRWTTRSGRAHNVWRIVERLEPLVEQLRSSWLERRAATRRGPGAL